MCLLFIVFGLSFYANLSFFVKTPQQLALFPPFIKGVNRNINSHLGAEYYFIAKALISGKGFSNPFQVDTGPTAWMSPAYPFLLALLLKIFKTRALVALVVIILQDLVLVMTGVLIYAVAKRSLSNIKPYFTLFFYTAWLIGFFWWFFQITHDIWIVLFFVDIIFLLSVVIWSRPGNTALLIILGVISGFASLTNPALGLVVIAILYKLAQKVSKKKLLISAVILFSIVSVWIARNYAVFNKFIPIKSNLYYDAYEANYIKADGILDEKFFAVHPVWTTKDEPGSEYRKLGEVKFSELYKKRLLDKLAKKPQVFLRNIKNRLLDTLLIYHPYDEDYETALKPFLFIIHALPFCSLLIILFLKRKYFLFVFIFLFRI